MPKGRGYSRKKKPSKAKKAKSTGLLGAYRKLLGVSSEGRYSRAGMKKMAREARKKRK